LAGSDIEALMMRDEHVLVDAVESDVMVGLRNSDSQSRQQGSKDKVFLHSGRCYRIKHQVIGRKTNNISDNTQLFPNFATSFMAFMGIKI
jgi:hypothetical protein